MRGSQRAPRIDYKGQWEKYQSWQAEDEEWYDKTLSSTKARLAASGAKAGDSNYDRVIADVEKEYAEKQTTLQSGATGKSLQAHYKALRGSLEGSIANSKEWTATKNEHGQITGYQKTRESAMYDKEGESPTEYATVKQHAKIQKSATAAKSQLDLPMEEFMNKRFGTNPKGDVGAGNKINQVKSNVAKGAKFGTVRDSFNPWMSIAGE